MRKQLLAILVSLSLAITSSPAVQATTKPQAETKEEAKGGITDEDLRKEISCSEVNFNQVKACIPVLQADGYSDAAIAGLLGNAWQESHWSPLAEGGFGLCDSYSSEFGKTAAHNACKELASETGHCPIGSSHKYCSKMIHNIQGVMESFKKKSFTYVDKYNTFMAKNYDTVKSYKMSGTQSSSWGTSSGASMCQSINIKSIDDFKSCEDPREAAVVFALVFEVCAGAIIGSGGTLSGHTFTIADWSKPYKSIINSKIAGTCGDLAVHELGSDGKDTRAYKALRVYEWLTGDAYTNSNTGVEGVEGASEVAPETVELAQSLYACGYWSEKDLDNFCRLNEITLRKSEAESLTVAQRYTLEDWKLTVKDSSKDTFLIGVLRKVVAFVGFLLILWVVLLYLAYWYDRVAFIHLSLLEIVSFHKLVLSPEEDKCTWKSSRSGKVVSVNHRAMITIVLLGLVLGAALISGVALGAVRSLILLILEALKISKSV